MTIAERKTLDADIVRLRPMSRADINDILRYVRAAAIAENTFVPQPYAPDDAREFVEKALESWEAGEAYVFAVIDAASGGFAGCMGIHLNQQHKRAEVGYWLGEPFWGRGLATAALRRLLRFGFETLGLNRIEAGHFPRNPASGRVMQKAGMRYEGLRREYVWHRDRYRDLRWHAILRADYAADPRAGKEETAED